MFLDVLLLNKGEVVLQAKAKSVMVPGENGVFEVLAFHKPIISRLVSGKIFIDNQVFSIFRGILKANQNEVIIIFE